MTVTIKASNLIEYLRLRRSGWRTLWVGEGLICMKKGEI